MKLEGQVAGMKDKFVQGFCRKMEIFSYNWESIIKIYLEEMIWMGVDQIGSGRGPVKGSCIETRDSIKVWKE
jgi:hypothetical protein